jgi:hypothetical protein
LERLSAVLKDMGFSPCYADPDVWMKHMGDHYDYIGVYVDDLEIASKDPEAILNTLMGKYEFKLKDLATYHLGCEFYRDDEGVLNQSARKYIDKMVDNYTRMFKAPKKFSSPLEKGDHPELDDSEELEIDEIKIYQSLIDQCNAGALAALMSAHRHDLVSFRAAPRRGHLDRAKRLVGYLYKMKHASIRYDTDALTCPNSKIQSINGTSLSMGRWKNSPATALSLGKT